MQTANAVLAMLAAAAVLLPKYLGTTSSVTVWLKPADIKRNIIRSVEPKNANRCFIMLIFKNRKELIYKNDTFF
jgi:L-serine deaminase